MKKTVFYLAFILGVFSANAQETVKDSTKLWKKGGNFLLLFNQSAFNAEWLAGGTSSIAGNLGLNYDFNYKKDDVLWDTKIIVAYGLTKIKEAAKTAKTDDRLELNSLWGKKASGQWYYSVFFNLKTQMDSGFDRNGFEVSHFFSPAYFQFGPGMLWKKDENLSINIAPITPRLILVDSKYTLLGSSFGVLQGDSSRFEFGASVSAYYKLNVMANVKVENRLNLYSNYLDNPQNIDVDYQMNVVMKINRYMSTNIALQTIYDDNAVKAVQVREVFGIGLDFSF
ncbi:MULTISPECIES: DUF3078 domain-containing protein [unclassified Flavobacterium]|jgi:hypothetical protein|uniref:DUF3078 domain-containing protein n=1 Tax=unclassified Flavobacterium TaxID=196869 RepID=UPI0025C0F1C3|nr:MULTISPECIES: DUF3078 domain-containing protein [unclassified Flavobacterium]